MAHTEREIIGSLLMGGSLLFGKRVELAWPDGLPGGMDQEALRSIGEEMAGPGFARWVAAAEEFCFIQVPCGKPLANGECSRHGTPGTLS